MQYFYFYLSLYIVQSSAQFRGFSNSGTNSNHDLLKQIVDHTPEEEENLNRFGGGRRTSILDRARSRPNTFGSFPRTRPRFTPSVPRFGSNNVDLISTKKKDQCEDLKSENELLKRLVDQLSKQQQEAEVKEKLLQSQLSPSGTSSPLSLISEALRSRLGINGINGLNPLIPGFNERGVRRVLTQAEPEVTTTTVITTTSSVTRDLSILFQGRYSTTHILDTVIETSTITDTITNLVTITPSLPLPLVQQVNTINADSLLKIKEQDRSFRRIESKQDSLDSFETLKGYLSKFQNTQPTPPPSSTTPRLASTPKPLIERLKERANLYSPKRNRNFLKERISSSLLHAQLEAQATTTTTLEPSFTSSLSSWETSSALQTISIETSPIPSVPSVIVNVASNVRVEGSNHQETESVTPDDFAQETVAIVTPNVQSSVITVYISGSVPGVFTTSLSTILFNNPNGDATNNVSDLLDRKKRHVEALIKPTKTVNIAESDLMEDYLDIIESGLNSFEYVDECKNQVTVTVTTTVSQCQAK